MEPHLTATGVTCHMGSQKDDDVLVFCKKKLLSKYNLSMEKCHLQVLK